MGPNHQKCDIAKKAWRIGAFSPESLHAGKTSIEAQLEWPCDCTITQIRQTKGTLMNSHDWLPPLCRLHVLLCGSRFCAVLCVSDGSSCLTVSSLNIHEVDWEQIFWDPNCSPATLVLVCPCTWKIPSPTPCIPSWKLKISVWKFLDLAKLGAHELTSEMKCCTANLHATWLVLHLIVLFLYGPHKIWTQDLLLERSVLCYWDAEAGLLCVVITWPKKKTNFLTRAVELTWKEALWLVSVRILCQSHPHKKKSN